MMIGSAGGYDFYNMSAAERQPQNAADICRTAAVGDSDEISQSELRGLKRSGAVECATCASRKYQDGSNEGNVSFKAAAHIDPKASAGKVMAHEQEHVRNAYSKAQKKDGAVKSATVTLQYATCPECGRSYVAGGVTNTTIRYKEENPYGRNQKSMDYLALVGQNVDLAA